MVSIQSVSKVFTMAEVIEEVTGISTSVPGAPLFVTPLGIAMHNQP